MKDNALPPLVSIVSAYYNRADYVRDSVESLLAQTYPNLEIIIVDDGSKDATLAELRRFDDPRLRIVEQENSGFTVTMNRVIRSSRGAFVAVHGSGDLSLPGRIAAQAQVLIDRPDVGVVGCWVENDNDDGSGTRILKSPNGLPFGKTLLERNLFTHGETMYRRDLYDWVGGYREFFRFAQDRDLWLRIAEHADYAIVPEVLYRRLKVPGGVSLSPDRLLLQAYLSDFGAQCARARMAGEADPIERHGHLAGFLRKPSAAFARRMAWLGARWMLADRIAPGWALVERANREYRSRQVAMIHTLCAMHRNPLLWRRIGRPVLEARLRSFRAGPADE